MMPEPQEHWVFVLNWQGPSHTAGKKSRELNKAQVDFKDPTALHGHSKSAVIVRFKYTIVSL